jgi:hypothetical protein
MVDTPVVIPLLSLRLEVDARPYGDHVKDSAIRLIGEVFLLWCLGVILVVWVLVMRRRRWGWDDLYFLMVWVCVVGWVLDGAVVVWLWVVVVICVRDNSLVVGWLCSRHPDPSGLCFQAIPGWVCVVFAMKQAIISTWLLRPSPAPASCAMAAALGGIFLMARGLASGVLVGYVVHLLPTAAVLSRVWLQRPCPGLARLRRVLGLPLRLDLSLMELFRSGILLEQLIELLEIFGWVPDAVTV